MTQYKAILQNVSGILCAILALPLHGIAQAVTPVTPRDCVTVRYLLRDSLRSSLQVNPQGDYVAYLIKSPDLKENRNTIELHVSSLASGAKPTSRMLLSSVDISSMQWEADGRHLVGLIRNQGRRDIEEVDIITGQTIVLVRKIPDIAEYSITPDAKTVVFATEDAASKPDAPDLPRTSQETAQGYRIPFTTPERSAFPRRRIFVMHRGFDGRWSPPTPIKVRSPLTGKDIQDVPYEGELGLSIAPDGELVLFRYIDSSTDRPSSWSESSFVKKALVDTGFSGTPLLVLYSTTHKTTTVPLQSPFPNGIAVWSADSNSFMINAQSPVGSEWEKEDIQAKRLLASKGEHLFWVELISGKVRRVAADDAQLERLISWRPSGDLFVRTAVDQITQFAYRNERWQSVTVISIPIADISPFSQIAGDSDNIVVDDQNLTTPPQLLLFHPLNRTTQVLEKLNPQFDNLTLAPAKHVSWTMPDGYPIEGVLFTPPDYKPDYAYPLVISATVYGGGFVCDSGDIHLPSFAPQPIADSGILYLMRTYPSDWTLSKQQEHYPKGYPGGIAEAVFQTEVWDSAVDTLTREGIVDRNRVGIIGFSRSGWYAEFALAHGRTSYRAATSTDNVKYSLGEYWLSRREGTIRGRDAMYAGPPYGKTLAAWENYSISFNLDKIHTPLLLEQMGYGRQYDKSASPPLGLSSTFEIFTGLNRLGKAVDLYYYPDEAHQPEHPQARLGSLQRNLDWYRYWLQDYEDPSRQALDQYVHWRALKLLSQRH